MGLFIVGISYRLLLAALFYFVTNKNWFAKQFPSLGAICLVWALLFQSPLASMHVVTIIGFFFYDILGWTKKPKEKDKKKKRKNPKN
jgi:predicted membrane protein